MKTIGKILHIYRKTPFQPPAGHGACLNISISDIAVSVRFTRRHIHLILKQFGQLLSIFSVAVYYSDKKVFVILDFVDNQTLKMVYTIYMPKFSVSCYFFKIKQIANR